MPAAATTTEPPVTASAILEQIAASGLLSGVTVFVVGAVGSYALWDLLAVPGSLLKGAIPRGGCTAEVPGTTAMYFCSVKAGFLTALGPLLTLIAALVFRRPLATQLQKLTKRLPAASTPLIAPLLSTLLFSLVHASVHENTDNQTGIVPQRMFPALVGLFTFGATRLGPTIAKRFASNIEARNKVPPAARMALSLGVPLVLSYLLTNQERVTNTAQKEQVIALLTLTTTYAAFIPRDGDFLGAGTRLLSNRLSYKSRKRSP